MYLLRERSLASGGTPLFTRLPSDGTLLFPEFSVGLDFATRGVPERALMTWAEEELLPAGTVFVDIGAHVGTYSLTMARKASAVVAFECSPRTYNFLCANIALADLWTKVTAHRVALGNEEGVLPYYVRSEDGGGNGCRDLEDGVTPSLEVPVRTLDSYRLENVGLLKVDVEGFEKAVLQGAVETLARSGWPRVMFESWPPTTEIRSRLQSELFTYLGELGYGITPVNGYPEMYVADYHGPPGPVGL